MDTTNVIQRPYEYNTLTAKWQRKFAVNDFQQIAGRTGSAGTTEVVIASGTPTSNKNLYVNSITFSNQSGTACAVAWSNANSTIGYEYVASGGQVVVNPTVDYLAKVGNGNTFAMVVVNPVANGTYTASMSATRVPIDSKVEP